jgi:hypothetical protein
MGSPEKGSAFLETRWPGVAAISDPKRALFRAFALGRASVKQIFGLRTWREFAKAMRFGVGMPVGDTLALGGTFLTHGPLLISSDVAEHAGHVPPFEEFLGLARDLQAEHSDGAKSR